MAGRSRRLFSRVVRTDGGRIRYDESLYEFYNRAAGADFARARRLFESLYSIFPDEGGELRARFQAADRHHDGAVLELVSNAVLQGCGFDVQREPRTAKGRKVDFLARGHGLEFYAECLTLWSEASAAEERSQARIIATLDVRVKSRSFYVGLNFTSTPPQNVRLSRFCSAVQKWLDAQDPASVESAMSTDEARLPSRTFSVGGCHVEVTAWPRDNPGHTVVGPIFTRIPALQPDDVLKRLARKAEGRYGAFGKPYLLFTHGRRLFNDAWRWVPLMVGRAYPWKTGLWSEGFWVSGGKRKGNVFPLSRGRWRHRGISGVVVFSYHSIHDMMDDSPLLVPHPDAAQPVGAITWPFRQLHIKGDQYLERDSGRKLADVLDHEPGGSTSQGPRGSVARRGKSGRGRSPEVYLTRYRQSQSPSHAARVKEIAREFGVTTHAVRKALGKAGLSQTERVAPSRRAPGEYAALFRKTDSSLGFSERVRLLADELGVSLWTIYRALRDAGIKRPARRPVGPKRHSAAEYAARYRQLPDGLSYNEKVRLIRLEFGVYANAVRSALRRMGIEPV